MEVDRQKSHPSLPRCMETNITLDLCLAMCIYNYAEYHFARAETERDVDKQKERDNQRKRGGEGMSS